MALLLNYLLIAINLYRWIIIIHVICSLLRVSRSNSFFSFLDDIVGPLYKAIKKYPHSIGIIDLTPLIALLLMDGLAYILIKSF